MKIIKYALGTVFALVVLAWAPDVMAATVTIGGNVSGYSWVATGPLGSTGATGDFYAGGLPDGNYTLNSVTPPAGYYLSNLNGTVPTGPVTVFGGNVFWSLNFALIDGAHFVSQTGLTSPMAPGSTRAVTVTFRNMSWVTWATAQNFTLATINPYNTLTWIPSGRVALPASVPHNSNVTFSFNITAPSTPGTYNFQVQMLQEGVAWVTVPSTNVAIVVAVLPTGNVNWRQPSGVTWGDGNATFPFNSTMDITWASANATTCNVLSNGVIAGPTSTASAINGIALSAAGNYLIELRCTGLSGAVVIVDSYTITVSPPAAPVITNFTFTPSTVAWNTGSSVTWASTGADACSVPGLPATGPSGTNVPVGPFTATATYILTCTGLGGSSAPVSRTVTVTGGQPAPSGPNSLEARVNDFGSFLSIGGTAPYGSTLEFRWGGVANATSCYVSPLQGVSQFNGLQNAEYPGDGEEYGPVNAPGVYAVNLVCSGPGATNHTVDTIQITIGPAPTSSVDLKINGSDGPVTYPYNSTNIPGSWTLANITSCSTTANGAPLASGITASGTAAWPGPFTQPTTIVMTCTNPYGPPVFDSVLITMSGTININSNLPGLTWTLTGPQNYTTTANSIPNAIFGTYTLTIPAVTGYDAVITPCNPQNLNQTATACD